MRASIITVTLILAFTLNGCIVDRINARLKAKNNAFAQNQQTVTYQESGSKNLGVTVVEEVPQDERFYRRVKRVYQPTPAKRYIHKKKIIKKTIHKKRVVVKKKKYIKKHKRVKTKVKKVYKEPYSIEKNEADPELLGPQTTLKSNPLSKAKVKEDSKKHI